MGRNAAQFKPKRKKTGGRTKGTPNKFTGTVKNEVHRVFGLMQTEPYKKFSLESFAKKYPKEFYALAGKLIPMDVDATVKGGLTISEATHFKIKKRASE